MLLSMTRETCNNLLSSLSPTVQSQSTESQSSTLAITTSTVPFNITSAPTASMPSTVFSSQSQSLSPSPSLSFRMKKLDLSMASLHIGSAENSPSERSKRNKKSERSPRIIYHPNNIILEDHMVDTSRSESEKTCCGKFNSPRLENPPVTPTTPDAPPPIDTQNQPSTEE